LETESSEAVSSIFFTHFSFFIHIILKEEQPLQRQRKHLNFIIIATTTLNTFVEEKKLGWHKRLSECGARARAQRGTNQHHKLIRLLRLRIFFKELVLVFVRA